MDKHPIQGGLAILLGASCYRNRVRFRSPGPPWLARANTVTIKSHRAFFSVN